MLPSLELRAWLDVTETWMYRLFFVLLLAALFPFLALVFYAHPSADDFCYASAFRHGDYWDSVIGEYLGWKGRYSAILVTVGFHRLDDLVGLYPVPLLLSLVLLFCAILWYVRTLLESRGGQGLAVVSTLAVAVFYFSTMPGPAAALYWADGAFQYQLGNIFLLLSLGALLRLYRGDKPLFNGLLASVFIFIGTGATEIVMVALAAVVGTMSLWRLLVSRYDRLVWLWVLVVTAASCTLVVFAPGNAVRMELQPQDSRQFGFALAHSLFHGTATITDWLGNPGLWLLTILFAVSMLRPVYLYRVRRDASAWRLAVMLVLLGGVMYLSFFATWWSGATHPPPRTLNAIYLVFLVGWFALILEAVALIAQFRPLALTVAIFPVWARATVLLVPVSFAISLGTSGWVAPAYADLLYRAPEYDRLMQGRYSHIAVLKQQSGGGRVNAVLESIADPPRVLVFTDISSDPDDWRNSCFAGYYDLGRVTTVRAGG